MVFVVLFIVFWLSVPIHCCKKISVLSIVMLLLVYGNALWETRQYPVSSISAPACAKIPRTMLPSYCIKPLPIIHDARYVLFQNNPLYRRTYTVMRASTYTYGRDIWYGWHGGTDISTTIGTPVMAIGEWEVIFAWLRGSRWNIVTIRHRYQWWWIESHYAHLSKILVKKWDKVVGWQLIWEVGTSGNSTGPHLHFQIDRLADWHPYFPPQCAKMNIFASINQWICKQEIISNTIDPIAFLEKQWAIVSDTYHLPFVSTLEQIESTLYQTFISTNDIIIQQSDRSLSLWTVGDILIRIHNKQTLDPYVDLLPSALRFEYDTWIIAVIPNQLMIARYPTTISIIPKKKWTTTLSIRLGTILIKTETLSIDSSFTDTDRSTWLSFNYDPLVSNDSRTIWWLNITNTYDPTSISRGIYFLSWSLCHLSATKKSLLSFINQWCTSWSSYTNFLDATTFVLGKWWLVWSMSWVDISWKISP